MGGPNLEVFKVSPRVHSSFTNMLIVVHQFGMYILFPIGIMYYFGTNLDSRFSTPDFWPKEGQTHTIPFEREEIKAELERLKTQRLAARARRLEMERNGVMAGEVTTRQDQVKRAGPTEILSEVKTVEPEKSQFAREGGKGWFGWLS
jgi:protein PET100, fungi type